MIRRRRLTTRTCSLAELLPNLQVTSITGVPAGAGEQYAVSVKNAGEMDSPVGLRLGVDGKAPRFASVPGLAPGETATVSLTGARCVYRVRATADPGAADPRVPRGRQPLFHGCP